MFRVSGVVFYLLVAGTFYLAAAQVAWTELKPERLPVCPNRNHGNISLSCRYKQNENSSLDGITINQLAAGKKDVWLVKKSITHLSGSTPSYVKHNEEEIIIPYNYTLLKGSNITFRCEAYYTSGVKERYNITPVYLATTDKECSLRDEIDVNEKTTEGADDTSYKATTILGVVCALLVLAIFILLGLRIRRQRRNQASNIHTYTNSDHSETDHSEPDQGQLAIVSKFRLKLRRHLAGAMEDLNQKVIIHFLPCGVRPGDLFFISPIISAKELHTDDVGQPPRSLAHVNRSGTIRIAELFRKQSASRVLLYGAAGTGKSTVTQKIAWDWGRGNMWNDEYDLVFHLQCSELTLLGDTDVCLAKLLRKYHSPDDTTDSVWTEVVEFIKHNPSRVLIIIDGLDELSGWDAARNPGAGKRIHSVSETGEVSAIVYNLVKKNILRNAHIIVTSRQSAACESSLFDDVFVASGFDSDAVQQCISKMCFCDPGIEEKVQREIAANHQLKAFCVVPLTCVLCVALILEDNTNCSRLSNATRILQQIVLYLVHKKDPANPSLNSLDTFTAAQRASLMKLCALAARASLASPPRSKLNDSDLSDISGNDDVVSALLELDQKNAAGVRRRLRSASFVHPSVQEFLAALHVCLTWQDEDITRVAAINENSLSRLDNVQINCLGLLGDVDLGHGLLRALLPENHRSERFYQQRDLMLNTILYNVKAINARYPSNTLSPIGKLQLTRCVLEANVTNNHTSISMGDISSALLTTADTDSGLRYDKVLSLRSIPGGLSQQAAFSVGQYLSKLQGQDTIQGLDLMAASIAQEGMKAMAAEGCVAIHKLKYIELSDNNIENDGLAEIASSLKSDNKAELEYLGLKKACLSVTSVDFLAGILSKCPKLKELALYGNCFKEAGAKKLADNLSCCNELEYLSLDQNGIGTAACDIAFKLKYCIGLKHLGLEENGIGDTEVLALVEHLSDCNELQALQLDTNNIGDEGAEALARGIRQHWPKLITLDLAANNITTAGARALIEALKYQKYITIKLYGQQPNALDPQEMGVAAELKDRILM